MDKNKKCLILIVVVMLIFGAIGFFLVVLPRQQGLVGVYQQLVCVSSFLLFLILCLILNLFCNHVQNIDNKKDLKCNIILIILMISMICMIFSPVRALIHGVKTVECDEYSIDFHTAYIIHPAYQVKLNCDDGEIIYIYISRGQYYQLWGCNKRIEVTYYPYANIVDTIRFLE